MQDILELPPPPGGTRIPYGNDPNQFGELRLPAGPGPHPVVIFIHGGFWREKYTLDHAAHACQALADAGYAVWSLEYRRIGQPGGGHAGTAADIEVAAGFLASIPDLDLSRAVAVGHSAGGYLALWLASRGTIPLSGVVALAPVADLDDARKLRLGDGVVDQFLGGSTPSPMQSIPVPQILVHGTNDDVVPFEISRRFAGKSVNSTLTALPDAGHFEVIDPRSPEWRSVVAAIGSLSLKSTTS